MVQRNARFLAMAVALLSLGLLALVIRGLDRGWLSNTAAIVALAFAFAAASIQLLSLRRMSRAEATSTVERLYLTEVIRRFGPTSRTVYRRRPVRLRDLGTGEGLPEQDLAARLAPAEVGLAVLTAPHGGGKTSLLRHLVASLATDRQSGLAGSRLPMLIWSRDWSPKGEELPDFLAKESGVPLEVVTHWAETGALLVIIDGLDELRSSDRRALMRQVKHFRADFPHVKVLLSDQPGFDDSYLVPDLQLEIEAISPAEVEEWLTDLALSSDGPATPVEGDELDPPGRRRVREEEDDGYTPSLPQEIQYEASYRRTFGVRRHSQVAELLGLGDGAAVVSGFEQLLQTGSTDVAVAVSHDLIPALLHRGDESAAAEIQRLAVGIFREPSEQTQLPTVDGLSTDEKRVYAVLSASVAQDLAQVASAAELRPSVTSQALTALEEAGLVRVSGDRYRLALERGH
ncbi:NACHT domain-containing protein [Kribbella deserti]|uniref:NACHT domain-containing protein n=1 Tax=Kribbella deserti TaxID=1926257 RepID=A0ABV6QR86_9ACTN